MSPSRSYDFEDLGLLSGPPDPSFVSGSRLAAELLGVEYGKVTLLDAVANRVRIRASFGFEPDELGLDWKQTDLPLCRKIMADQSVIGIGEANDMGKAPKSPFLQALGGRSYLGAPIYDPVGTPVGTLCVIGRAPRIWSGRQKEQVSELAGLLSQAITLKAALATIRLLSPPTTRA